MKENFIATQIDDSTNINNINYNIKIVALIK